VEAQDLSSFLVRFPEWPDTLGACTEIAEAVRELLDIPFCAVAPMGSPLALAVSPELQSHRDETEALIHEQTRSIFEQKSSSQNVRRIKISDGKNSLGGSLPDFVLSFSRFGKAGSFVAVASERELSAKEELFLIAVSHHLHEAYVIHLLHSEIDLRSQFLSIASHELKTPLTSIYGILQLQERMLRLKKDEPAEARLERQHSFLKMVIRQVERLNELIDGLLDVSRIQNGRFVVEPTECDVALLLRETAQARLSVIAEEAGVSLHLDSPEVLNAWVDPVRMEEVINNLIMNAIRFSPEGGIVWITLDGHGDSLKLTIRDQGPSVPIEDQERIFHPFERAQRTGRLGGLGLGLFISREIAALHGGSVQLVESIAGKGNIFEAVFPLREMKRESA